MRQDGLVRKLTVYLSVGPHNRPPRSYRGRDFCWWLGVLGEWDVPTLDPRTAHVTIAVSGANGGHTVDFRSLAARGMTLVGMTADYDIWGVWHDAKFLADHIDQRRKYLALRSTEHNA